MLSKYVECRRFINVKKVFFLMNGYCSFNYFNMVIDDIVRKIANCVKFILFT